MRTQSGRWDSNPRRPAWEADKRTTGYCVSVDFSAIVVQSDSVDANELAHIHARTVTNSNRRERGRRHREEGSLYRDRITFELSDGITINVVNPSGNGLLLLRGWTEFPKPSERSDCLLRQAFEPDSLRRLHGHMVRRDRRPRRHP